MGQYQQLHAIKQYFNSFRSLRLSTCGDGCVSFCGSVGAIWRSKKATRTETLQNPVPCIARLFSQLHILKLLLPLASDMLLYLLHLLL